MKIAITSPYDFSVPGGVQTHIVELSRELSQRGNEVTIFAPLSLTNIHTLDDVEFIDLGKPVTFSFLGSQYKQPTVETHSVEGEVRQSLKKSHITHFTFFVF